MPLLLLIVMSLFPNQIHKFVNELQKDNIKLGCHFHNNCGLALAGTLAAMIWL